MRQTAASPRTDGPFAGTGQALRFALKRDRLLLPLCVLGLIGWVGLYVASYSGLYGTQADLNSLYESVAGNPALVAMVGPTDGLRTLGGATAWETLPVVSVISAIFAMFVVVRHTRAEEEDGRSELLLASGSGRLATLTAAMIITAGALVIAAVGWYIVFLATGYEADSSLLLVAAILGVGLVFTGTTAICAQVTAKSRTARGLVGIVIGLAYFLRALGDTGPDALTWISPLGWAEKTEPFLHDNWWPLLLPVVASFVTAGFALWLLERRDIGSGLIQPRPGPARAHPSLLHPLGFSLRIQRGSIVGWTYLLFVYGFAIGAVGNNIEGILESSSSLTAAFAGASGDIVDSYFATIFTVLALMASGFAIGGVLRPHSEETHDRAALLMAGPLGKVRWALGHVLIAYVASAVMMALLGLGLGLGLGVVTGDFSELGTLVASGFAQAPAIWLTASLAVLLFGISSRASAAAWGLLVAFVVIWSIASFGDLPDWIVDLSPFSHIPAVPAVPLDATPLLVMTALAAVFTTAGMLLWRRRDLP
jgi:ABC-2 type transport system permease protein